MKVEVGSKWVCKEDEPYSTPVVCGEIVEIVKLNGGVIFFKPLRFAEEWYGMLSDWKEYFGLCDAEDVHWIPVEGDPKEPDGGPSAYYDFPEGMVTLNDYLEYMGETSWKGDSFHLANIVKAATRWGRKGGTSREYDARKFIYSGCRLLMKYAGAQEVRNTLKTMLDDPQFQERK